MFASATLTRRSIAASLAIAALALTLCLSPREEAGVASVSAFTSSGGVVADSAPGPASPAPGADVYAGPTTHEGPASAQ